MLKPLPERRAKKTLRQRIEKKITKQDDGCWIWTGAKAGGRANNNHKYGYISIGDKKIKRVHRVYYEMIKNIEIGDKNLCHTCDVTLCVNPDHMFVGTQQDNVEDMIKKGRKNYAVGEECNSKLTVMDVFDIRARGAKGEEQVSIAKDFPVNACTIGAIINRRIWKHI